MRGALVLENGEMMWPPPQLAVSLGPSRPAYADAQAPSDGCEARCSQLPLALRCMVINELLVRAGCVSAAEAGSAEAGASWAA